MAIDSEAWLNLTKENPIEPDIPICDSHMHMWEGLEDHYLPDDFLLDIDNGHNIVKTVFIQTSRGSSAWGKGQTTRYATGRRDGIYRKHYSTKCG